VESVDAMYPEIAQCEKKTAFYTNAPQLELELNNFAFQRLIPTHKLLKVYVSAHHHFPFLFGSDSE